MKRLNRIKILPALLSAAFVANVAAVEDDLYFTEMPIVASVSRLPQKLSEAPAAVTVIDRDMIRASGFRTVEDLMRLVPGFLVASHNQDSALVAYHGLTGGMSSEEYSPRVQVLIDGRSQYSPLFKSGVNWNLLPVALENIERIEVVRGSNTVAYGSNAALGVINIITQDTSQTKGWMLAANRGSNGIRDETLRWGGKVGEADVRFTAHELGDQGFRLGNFQNYATGQSDFWWDMPDSRRSRVLDLKVDLALGNRDELQFSLSQATDVSQFGRPNVDPNYASSLKYPLWYLHTSSTAMGLQWKRLVSAGEELKLRYNFTQDESSGSYLERSKFSSVLSTGDAIGFNVVDAGGTSQIHELEFEHIKPLDDQARLVWGASGKSIALYSLPQFSSSQWLHRTHYRTFGNVEYRPSQDWLFNMGASLERDSLSGVQFDPRLSASYHLTPENTVRMVASRAHRTPSLYEYMGKVQKFGIDQVNGLTAKNLEYFGQGVAPERIDSLELGYLGEWKALRASLDVRRFIEHIPNRIQVVPLALPASSPDDNDHTGNRSGIGSNTAYLYGRADGAVNMENVLITGSEYQFRWQPFDSTRLIYSQAVLTITADPDYSVVADDAAGGGGTNTTKITQQTRQSAPASAQSAMLIQQLPYNVQASVMYFRTGPMLWRRNSEVPTPASERFDWRLSKTFKVGSSRVELAYTEQMVNGSQEGRVNFTRFIDKLQWLTLRVDF